ncbi:MAG: preprotein translocase subunit YajC [Bacteroidota bacterium]|nr:preprotein translocase subunit YajC [bacterium]NBP64048.1 preprotein translocase subunit YajC [Bacteroidota bacterium]
MPFFPIELQAQQGQAASGDPVSQLLTSLLPMAAIFAVFYFLMIRPQRKRHNDHMKMISELKKGDKVVTSAGIHGTVDSVEDSGIIKLKIADATIIKIDKVAISQVNVE